MSPPQLPGTTAICHKLLWIWYYYAHCFGMALIGIRQCEDTHINTAARLQETETIITINRQNQGYIKPLLRAHSSKTTLWLHALIRLSLCSGFTYIVYKLWLTDDYIFFILVYAQLATMVMCPFVMAMVVIYHSERVVQALNELFLLISDVRELHGTYEMFQWTHVVFVALKVGIFIYEIGLSLLDVFTSNSIEQLIAIIVPNILLIEIWFNIHAATLLYVSLDAIYGVLNHYIRYEFIPRLRMVQPFGLITTASQRDRLISDMSKFIDLFKNIHRVGSELHFLWQLPGATTLVYVYCGMISVLYYMIWQYYETGVLQVRYIPFLSKLVVDILLLSLAAHRAIKSSQLIRWMGLENAMLVEDDKWHKQMDQFLYHIKLNEFKLNLLGLFDISNAMTVTFIGGILTSICIFLPFLMEK